MASSTTPIVNLVGLQDPGGTHPNITTPSHPYNQEQHGNTDTGNAAPNVVIIVVGVVVPLVLIGIGAFIVYVWYRRKYPVRMVPGRDFAKFSNPAYNKRQSTLTLVREDGDREWDDLGSHNPIIKAVREDEVDGIDNAAFDKETDRNVPDEFVKVEIEDDVEKSNTVQTKVEEQVTRKISRERPKTKKAVLVKSQDIDEFENAFELVSESDLGQRTDSEISSGNDSTGTHTVSVSFSETFDNRHGSVASQPEQSKSPDIKVTKTTQQSIGGSESGDHTSGQKGTSEKSASSEIPEHVNNFESFVEVFNNEILGDNVVETSVDTNSEENTELPDDKNITVTEVEGEETENSWVEIENSSTNVAEHVTSKDTEPLDIKEKEKTESTEKGDRNLSPEDNNTWSLRASAESLDKASLNESFTSDLLSKRPSLPLSKDRIPNFLDIAPQSPTVLVQDSIIFESENMPQIHLVNTEAYPLRGRRAFTMNDLRINTKTNAKEYAASDQNLSRHVDVRSTSSPEIHELKYDSFKTTEMTNVDFRELNKTSQVLTQTNDLPSEPESADGIDNRNHSASLADTLSDNMLLDSTFIKNEVRNTENKSGQILNTEEEYNASLGDSVHSELNAMVELQDNSGNVENMFMSISSVVSETLETSDDLTHPHQEIETAHTVDQTEVNVNEREEKNEMDHCSTGSQIPAITVSEENDVAIDVHNTREKVDEDNTALTLVEANDDKVSESNKNQFGSLGQTLSPTENESFVRPDKESNGTNAPSLASSAHINSLHDEFATSFLHTSTPTASGVEDTKVAGTDESDSTSKKKLTAGGFDFSTFDVESDSDTSSSSSLSENSEDETRKSFEISTEENTGSFERVSKHSDFNTSYQSEFSLTLDKGPNMSKSVDSTTLSWELLSRENSVDSRQADVNYILDIDESTERHIHVTDDKDKSATSVPNVSIESSDLSWDVIGRNDDNSEC